MKQRIGSASWRQGRKNTQKEQEKEETQKEQTGVKGNAGQHKT